MTSIKFSLILITSVIFTAVLTSVVIISLNSNPIHSTSTNLPPRADTGLSTYFEYEINNELAIIDALDRVIVQKIAQTAQRLQQTNFILKLQTQYYRCNNSELTNKLLSLQIQLHKNQLLLRNEQRRMAELRWVFDSDNTYILRTLNKMYLTVLTALAIADKQIALILELQPKNTHLLNLEYERRNNIIFWIAHLQLTSRRIAQYQFIDMLNSVYVDMARV